MFNKRISNIFGVFLLMTTGYVLADEGVGGGASQAMELDGVNLLNKIAPSPLVKVPFDDLTAVILNNHIRPFDIYKHAGHVANGVALRNRTSGTIHLRGIQQPSRIKQAFLYWNFSDDFNKGEERAAALINGNRVDGKKVADNEDPCWGMAGNHTYRADVTPYVPLTRPNEDYHVVLQFDQMTSTTGQNPWSPIENQEVRTEGAWLIVIYENEQTQGKQVALYDNLSGTEFSGTQNLNLHHPTMSSGPALFTMCGADGQRGYGHTNVFSNETSWFNGEQIAGPPVASSDWDGSDGWPLPQLSDTHTHHVKLDDTNIGKVRYVSTGDCLVPVAFVLESQ